MVVERISLVGRGLEFISGVLLLATRGSFRAFGVRGRTVVEGMGERLALCLGRAPGGGDRISVSFGLLVLVGKEQRSPRLDHVQRDVVGEHAQDDVRAHPIGEPAVNGPDFEIGRFQRTKRALYLGE